MSKQSTGKQDAGRQGDTQALYRQQGSRHPAALTVSLADLNLLQLEAFEELFYVALGRRERETTQTEYARPRWTRAFVSHTALPKVSRVCLALGWAKQPTRIRPTPGCYW